MASNLQQAKKLLRKEIKARIKQLTQSERETQSSSVVQKLITTTSFEKSQRISVYLPMSDEINTLPLVKTILDANKDCFIPKYVGDTMEMVRLHSFDEIDTLPLTSWNIRQPADDEDNFRNPPRENALKTGGLDLIVVPGLGFTRDGWRIGRGKGFYDTYIQRCADESKRKPQLIALAFSEQIYNEIPVDERDYKVDLVLFDN